MGGIETPPQRLTAGSQKLSAMVFLFFLPWKEMLPWSKPTAPQFPIPQLTRVTLHGMVWTSRELGARNSLVHLGPSPVPHLTKWRHSVCRLEQLPALALDHPLPLQLVTQRHNVAFSGSALPTGSHLPWAESAALSSRSTAKPNPFGSRALDRPN